VTAFFHGNTLQNAAVCMLADVQPAYRIQGVGVCHVMAAPAFAPVSVPVLLANDFSLGERTSGH